MTNVFRDLPADKAGLKMDDVIIEIAGESMKGLDDLQMILAKHKAGDEVKMTVLRGDDKVELKAKLAGTRLTF